MQASGGAAEVQLLGKREEIAEVAQFNTGIHNPSLLMSRSSGIGPLDASAAPLRSARAPDPHHRDLTLLP
ncbi:hypothetical protein ACFPRL_18960 [Pseudoclavibacter helvolus]